MRTIRLVCLFLLLGFAPAVCAQVSGPATNIRFGPTDPPTCQAGTGMVFMNTTSGTLKTCNTTDTWTAVAGAGSGDALVANPLSQFASTTSAQLASTISNETGNTLLVFNTSPTLVTPVLGVASVTSINKVTITAPATSATLTIIDGKVATISNTLTFTGTDSSSVAFGAGGTVLYSGGALGTPSSGTLTNATGLPIAGIASLGAGVGTWLATPSSANLITAVSDETGSGALVFANTPTLVTPNIGAATGTSLVASGIITGSNITSTGQTYYINLGQTVFWKAGTGSPESNVTGGIGSMWSRTDGTTDTALYRKETGTGNTGWVAVAAGGAGGATTALNNLASVAINTDLLPASTQSLGNASFPFLSSFTGNTTQYESVAQSAGLVTHSALGSATNIGWNWAPKGTGLFKITSPTVSGAAVFEVRPVSGNSFTRINDNGTVVIDADSGTGTVPLIIKYNGSQVASVTYLGTISGVTLSNAAGSFVVDAASLRIISNTMPLLLGASSDVGLTRNAAGILEANAGTQNTLGLLLAGRVVTAKTSDYSVVTANKSTMFTNVGAGGTVNFTLPTAAVGLQYDFCRVANQSVTVIAGASTTIRLGAAVTASAGNISLDAVGSCARLVAISTTEWYIDSATGTVTTH
jgi:hypothetical protein